MGEKTDHRYHLLVIGGMWASTLQIKGVIEIPQTDEAWYSLTKFIKNRVDDFMKKEVEIPFDMYIRAALINKFG